MYHYDDLMMTLHKLYFDAIDEADYAPESVEELFGQIDISALLQAVRHNAQTVYAYTTQGKQSKSFNYRSCELFDQRATLLYDEFDSNTAEVAVTDRSYELWLLEDMSLVVTARVTVDFNCGEYVTVYREIIGEPYDGTMSMELEELTMRLQQLYDAVYESEQPVYEL